MLIQDNSFWEVRNGKKYRVHEDSWKQMPPLGHGVEIQQLIGECIIQGIKRVEDIWVNKEDDEDFSCVGRHGMVGTP